MSAHALTSPLDRWARRGAWCALVSLAAALLWLGLSMYRPSPVASGANPVQDSADLASARSSR
jgi:hypothetical protein